MGQALSCDNRTRQLLELQVRVLKLIATGTAIEDVLATLAQSIEQLEPECFAGVTIVDRTERSLEMAIFPSLPRVFSNSIAGVPLEPPHVGTCAQALFRGAIVTSENLNTDNRFSKDWISLCLTTGIQSCRSQPVQDDDGAPLGTFMLCFREPRAHESFNDTLMEVAADLVKYALQQRRGRVRQEIVIGELHHRAKNIFTTVGALAYFTLQANPDPKEFRRAFDGRINALASAYSLTWGETDVDVRKLCEESLGPYARNKSVDIDGPNILLAPDAISALGMALHELATNAAKYGGLSTLNGSVSIGWTVKTPADQGPVFVLSWVETGGPEAHQPVRRGFGLKAMERLLAQEIEGKASLTFAAEGLRCLIEAPFTEKLGTYCGPADETAGPMISASGSHQSRALSPCASV